MDGEISHTPSLGEVPSWHSAPQKQVTGPQLPAEPGSGCPKLSQYVVQHSRSRQDWGSTELWARWWWWWGHITGVPCFWLNHGPRAVSHGINGSLQEVSQKILWAWLELFKVLLGYLLTPCSSSGHCPQRMHQSRALHSNLIIWTVLGSSLPAQASQSELDRRSVCCVA